MIRLRILVRFYRRHLRVQPLRELMAILGVAAGVALLFAVQIANTSITTGFSQVLHGVAGNATLEIAARSPEGFNENTIAQVAATQGVRAAAPILSQQVVVVGPTGTRALTFVGADNRLGRLGGKLVTQFEHYAEASPHGLTVLTQSTADAIGAKPGSVIGIKVGEHTRQTSVAAVVPGSKLGVLAGSPVAAAPLPIAQNIVGLPHRITRILVEPDTDQEHTVRQTLTQRFGYSLNVRPANTEGILLSNAAKPEAQLTALFSAISLIVGIILAYNALLLASGERRAFISHLVQLGATDATIVSSLIFDAFVLGVAGSVIGLLAGDAISLLAYHESPGYLAAAFPIGGLRIVSTQTVLIAFGAGILAAFAAATPPAIGALRSSPAEPEGRALALLRGPHFGQSRGFLCGALLVCVSIAASLLWPSVIVIALMTFAAGLVLCLPLTVNRLIAGARRLARRSGDPSARLASGELQTTRTRPVALFATGTIAVFLMVTIGGSVANVQSAVRLGAAQTGSNADLWIKPGGPQDVYGTQMFPYADIAARLRDVSVIQSALPYRQSFLDMPDRRMWVIGIPAQTANPVPKSQLIYGSEANTTHRLHEQGWAALSQTIAIKYGLHLGDSFSLPTPSGQSSFKLAATISNYGWLPGTLLVNSDDYARDWQTSLASQLAVVLRPGVTIEQGKALVQRALQPDSALTVQTGAERQQQVSSVLGSTLSRLNQTSTVVLVAAIATVIAMMISAVWQKRARIDTLVSMGMSFGQLSRLVFYESGCVLLGGCLLGLVSGNVGQYLTDRWTQHSAGSPVQFTVDWSLGLRTLLIACLISIAASIIAVLRTVGLQPKAAFSTD